MYLVFFNGANIVKVENPTNQIGNHKLKVVSGKQNKKTHSNAISIRNSWLRIQYDLSKSPTLWTNRISKANSTRNMGHNNIYSGSRIIQYRNNLEFNYGIRIFTGIIDPKRSIVHPSITVNETTCCHRVQLELTYSTYFKVLIYINIPVYITKTLPCQQKRKKRQTPFLFQSRNGFEGSFSAWHCKNSVISFQSHNRSWDGSFHWCIWPILYPSDFRTNRKGVLWARRAKVPDPTWDFVSYVGDCSVGHRDWSTGFR